MSGWTRETIQQAASWQAFKEGASLAQRGACERAERTPEGWRGAAKVGKRMFRVGVKFRSVADIEARCSCPENQASGALCAHAVAVALTVLEAPASPAPGGASGAGGQISRGRAWRVELLPGWSRALSRGQLIVRLLERMGAEATAADRGIDEWIVRQGCLAAEKAPMCLAGEVADEFLQRVQDHPCVRSADDARPLEVAAGARLPLESVELEGKRIHLKPSGDEGSWQRLGLGWWQIGDSQLLRAGNGEVPHRLRPLWEALVTGQAVDVPLRDMGECLDLGQDWLEFPSQGWFAELHMVPQSPRFRLSLKVTSKQVVAELRVAYEADAWIRPLEGQLPELPRIEGSVCHVRNLMAEQVAIHRLEAAGFTRGSQDWRLQGTSSIEAFVAGAFDEFKSRWEIVEDASFASLRRSIAVVNPHLEVIGSGADWLSFNIKFKTSDGNELSKEEVRACLRSSGGRLANAKGRQLHLSADWTDVMSPLLEELELAQADGHYEARNQSADVILEMCKNLHNPSTQSDLSRCMDYRLPSQFKAQLRPYQLRGVAWLDDRVRRLGGALLADDMGLGKTIQTIACVEGLIERAAGDVGPVLVVATASLLGNWRQEWERFAPGRVVHLMHGSQRDALREQVCPGDVVVTTYGTLSRDLAWHLRQDYLAVVVDEASLMRNPDTDHAKAVSKLRSGARIALTGTPVENGLQDLWSIFRFIQPGWLGSREAHAQRYGGAAGGELDSAALERLRLKLSPFLLRRTKAEVAPDLPSKIEIECRCDLSVQQQQVYRQLLEEGRRQVDALEGAGQAGAARMKVLTALMRLRQTCGDLALLGNESFKSMPLAERSTKLVRLIELLGEALEGGHKVLVFSQFQKQLLEIQQLVEQRGWDCLRLDGQTRDRQALVDRFQSADGPPIFLISLKAGGYGLNLTAADTVIHFDPWWNPAAESQATDRAHRIGQSRPVTVYRLLTRGTVEEKVVGLQTRKRRLAAMVDEGGQSDAAGWSMTELESLLADG